MNTQIPDNHKKILYIEDDLANRVLVSKVLTASNFDVMLAEDGLEGIKLANRYRPDLILVDMNMSGLDGYETATSIKSIPKLASVPVIAVTANSLPGDREKCLIAGCDGYITKPIDVSNFTGQITSYLGGKVEAVAPNKKEMLIDAYNAKLVKRLKEKVEELANYNRALSSEIIDKDRKINHAENVLLQSDKMASLGTLAAGIAHEINNPIGFISSNINALKLYFDDLVLLIKAAEKAAKNPGDSQSLSEYSILSEKINHGKISLDAMDIFNETNDGIRRVKTIVRDLKAYSHESSSKAAEIFDLEKCVNASLNIAINEIKYKAEVIKDLGDTPKVFAIEPQISQVMINLLVNAAQAIEKFGKIYISSSYRDKMVEVSIRDTGSGIPPEIINKLFDPFFTTKPAGKGTGLGLYICYQIIQKNGGQIGVTSTPGIGTEFVFSLPAAEIN